VLYRSSCGHNTDCTVPFVLWPQYRLCCTVRLVVTIPTVLYRSSCGHNTDCAVPFVLLSQYRLCYTVRLVVTIPTMLKRSCIGHNPRYAIQIPSSSVNLKRIRTVRQLFSLALRSAMLFDSAALNVLSCSLYQWCHSSHYVTATDMAINARC
jgi:hypothetical protein